MIKGNLTNFKLGAYGQNTEGFIKDIRGEKQIKKNPLQTASLYTPAEPAKYSVEALGGKDPETLFLQTKEAQKYLKTKPDYPLMANMNSAKSLGDEMKDNLLRAITNKYAQFKSQYLTEEESTQNLGKFLSSLARGGFGADTIRPIERAVDARVGGMARAPVPSELSGLIDSLRGDLDFDVDSELAVPVDFGDGGGLEGIVGADDEAPLRRAGLVPDSRSAVPPPMALPSSGLEEELQRARAMAEGEDEEEEEEARRTVSASEASAGGAPAFTINPASVKDGVPTAIEVKVRGSRVGTASISTLRKIENGEALSTTQKRGIQKLRAQGISIDNVIRQARQLRYLR